jgi:YegS/Rv2252/BmrU family lipid kinase
VEVDGVHVSRTDRNTFLFFDTNPAGMDDRSEAGRRIVVLNPKSGTEDHGETVHDLAADHGFEVRETAGEGDAPELAAEAAGEGAEFVVAAGGDGTLNEVLNGLHGAEALEDVTVGVVPAGTGNNFASNVGVEGIEHAFEVFADGERRDIDLGVAAGRAYVNSCVGGITAEASAATTPDAKRNFGVTAYVMNTVKEAVSYEGLSLSIETNDAHSRTWSGEAAFVLIGNGRRFPVDADTQANMEDGLMEVTIVEDGPTIDVVSEAATERLFGGSGDHIYRLKTPALTVRSADDDPVAFSLDGEMITSHEARIETLPGRVTMPVGEAYDPDPDVEASE